MAALTSSQKTIGTTLMACSTLGGLFLAAYVPLLDAILYALAGLPALVVMLAWGAPWFGVYGLITVGLTSLARGWPWGIIITATLLVPAGLLSALLKVGEPPMRAIATTLLLSCLVSLTLWSVAPLFGQVGLDLWEQRARFREYASATEAQWKKQLEKDGDSTAFVLWRENYRSVTDYVALLIPTTFIFLWHLLTVGLFYLAGRSVGPRFGFEMPSLPKFSTWRFDWNLIWLFLIGWLMFHGADSVALPEVRFGMLMIGANCLSISKVLYFLLGFSILFFFFEMYKITTANRITLSFLALFLSQILVWLGIIDVWFDFRAPKPPRRASDDDDSESFFDNF